LFTSSYRGGDGRSSPRFSELGLDAFVAKDISRSSAPEIHRPALLTYWTGGFTQTRFDQVIYFDAQTGANLAIFTAIRLANRA
jgi:hypothetical protein